MELSRVLPVILIPPSLCLGTYTSLWLHMPFLCFRVDFGRQAFKKGEGEDCNEQRLIGS